MPCKSNDNKVREKSCGATGPFGSYQRAVRATVPIRINASSLGIAFDELTDFLTRGYDLSDAGLILPSRRSG